MPDWEDLRIRARTAGGHVKRVPLRFIERVRHDIDYRTFVFDAAKYPGSPVGTGKQTHLESLTTASSSKSPAAPHRITCFWTGDNDLTPARTRSLDLLRAVNRELDVQLVTPQNLASIIRPAFPLHPAYEHLSLVHRSDYLRAYVMHHAGGGYSDIKAPKRAWGPVFRTLDSDASTWVIGYRELGPHVVGNATGALGQDLRDHFRLLVGMGAFIMRPGTPFTHDWIDELHKVLDRKRDQLAAHPGNIFGDNAGYPLAWSEILADITHPLLLKYHRHIRQDNRLKPDFRDYR